MFVMMAAEALAGSVGSEDAESSHRVPASKGGLVFSEGVFRV